MATFDVLGVLATESDVQSRNMSDRVFVNAMGALQFIVKPISVVPDQWENKLYTGYWQNGKYDFEDDDHLDAYIRKAEFVEWMKGKLVVFKPVYRAGYYKIEDLRIVQKPDMYEDKSTYSAIPVFSNKVHGISKDEFKQRLKNNRFIGKIDNISHDDNDVPNFILWKNDNDGEMDVYGPIDSYRYAFAGFSFVSNDLKEEIKFRDEWFEDVVSGPNIDSVVFIGADIQREISLEMEKASKCNVSENANLDGATKHDINLEQEQKKLTEEIFIERFIDETKKNGFIYSNKDLVNFHTAMKISNLVILSGMSGTGKSRLVDFYRRALGIPEERAEIIPVRSSWTDDSDLIGYVDLMHMVYRPGDSGLVNILIDASKNRDQLYIVCFDEMNLARVEHYFSQFLSLLETDINRRYLKLYNDELEPRLYNSAYYPPSVRIGDNVIFVGTVNMDESTYHFSDKVLDRANVISLVVRPFAELKALKEGKSDDDKKDPLSDKKDPLVMSSTDYFAFKIKTDKITLTDSEVNLLREMHDILNHVNRNIGVGFRILNQIDLYIANLPNVEYFTRQEAFDKQIVQRVLTKIRGSEDQLKVVVGKYVESSDDVTDSQLIDLLDRFESVSSFTESKKVIKYKAKELKIYGFTM